MKKIIFLILLALPAFGTETDINKVVKIFTSSARKSYCATAFYISDNQLLTAAHTFGKGSLNPRILKDGVIIHVRLIKIDYNADIALIETDVINTDHYVLCSNGKITAVGFPGDDRKVNLSAGRMIQLQSDNALPAGMSGSPMVNESGVVVGMAIQSDDGRRQCFCVPSDTLLKFLAKP